MTDPGNDVGNDGLPPPPLTNQEPAADNATVPAAASAHSFPTNSHRLTVNYVRPINNQDCMHPPLPFAAPAASTTSSVAARSPITHPPPFVNAYSPPPLQFDASSIITGRSLVTFRQASTPDVNENKIQEDDEMINMLHKLDITQ